MRSAIGKQLRPALFRQLLGLFPGFQAVRRQRIPGFTWDFERVLGPDLVFRLTFQRHKYDDSFTLEFVWAPDRTQLDTARFVDVREGVSGASGNFRVGALWSGTGDYWWKVAPGKFDGIDLTNPAEVQAAILALDAPLASDMSARISAAVNDAMMRLKTALWPVMAMLAESRGYALQKAGSGAGASSVETPSNNQLQRTRPPRARRRGPRR